MVAPSAVDGDRLRIYTDSAAYPNDKQEEIRYASLEPLVLVCGCGWCICAAQSAWPADNFTRQDITFKSAGLNLVG
jgi:hypothetical protein